MWTSQKQKSISKAKKHDVDVNKILVSAKEPYGTKNALKYFIGCDDNDVNSPLCVRFLQMTGYAKTFDQNVTMSLKLAINSF